MEVISKVQDKNEEIIIDWFKKIFNIEDKEEIKSVIIYSNNERICEISFNELKNNIFKYYFYPPKYVFIKSLLSLSK